MYDEEPSYEDSDILLKQKEVRVKFYFPNLSNNEIIILDYPSIYQAIPSLHVNENKKVIKNNSGPHHHYSRLDNA
jgi:hypothetical protein